ncbi:hypothetical protein [Kangiella marina]|uniref:Uncharacterized protein n=1 Tax=Kangiella marina TaxID=1079178 RepID=A0ABP8ICK2_9GAMM
MKSLVAIALSSVLMMSASAHELPSTSLNSNQSVVIATSFSFNGSQIEDNYNDYSQFFDYEAWLDQKRVEQDLPPLKKGTCGDQMATAKTCGQVDHFYKAAMVGTFTCNAYASLHAASYPDGLTARFTAPTSFVDNMEAASGHHDYYDTAQGISFDCVYPSDTTTAEPAPKEYSKF